MTNTRAAIVLVGAAIAAAALTYRHFHTEEAEPVVLDATGIPTHTCPKCGQGVFKVLVSFEDYEVATYSLDGYCYVCGTKVTVPTLLDKEVYL